MKIKLILTMAFLMHICAFSQKVKNYSNQNEKKASYTTDYLQIKIDNNTITHASEKSTSVIPGLVGAVATIGIDIYEAIHDKRVASFSASTTNTSSFSLESTDFNLMIGGKKMLFIKRYGLNALIDSPDEKDLLEEYDIAISPVTGGGLQFTLQSFKLYYAKAFVKRDEKLAIGIDIKLTAGATPPVATSIGNQVNPSASGLSDSSSVSGTGQDSNTTEKNADKNTAGSSSASSLGEGVIKIPLCQTIPNGNKAIEVGKSEIINSIIFSQPTHVAGTKPPLLTFTVTLTEANVSKLATSTVDNLLKNHSADIISLIKSVLPSGSTSGK